MLGRGFEDFARGTAAFAHEPCNNFALHRKFNAGECGLEGFPDSSQRHAILRTLGSGDAWLDAFKVHVEDLVEERLRIRVAPEQTLLARVPFDQIDERTAARQLQVTQGVRVDREER